MKIFSKSVIGLSLLLAFAASAHAAEVEPEGTMLRKLQRGFLNVALSPLEISNELAKEKNTDTLPPSWITGTGRGACYMLGRALTGVYEMVTFAVPCPSGYQPILKPEFAWQYLPSSEKK